MQDNVLGSLVEGERYRSEPGTRRDYHLLTGGIIANEVDITTCHEMCDVICHVICDAM